MYSRVVIAILVLVAGANAQQQQAASQCAQAQGLPLNNTELYGTWYEVARNPAPSSNIQCVFVSVGLDSTNNESLVVNTTYGVNSNYMDKVNNFTIDLNSTSEQYGYNASYSLLGQAPVNTTFKLLQTDNTSYAFVCGYTNASDPNTAFGIILTRQQIVPWDTLLGYEGNASAQFANFANGTMANVTQSTQCYTSSGTTNLPLLTTVLALFYILFQRLL